MPKRFQMGRFKPKRGRRGGRKRANYSLIPVGVFPMTVNWTATANSGTHDVHPASASTTDVVWRPSSTRVMMSAPTPTVAQIQLFSSNAGQLSTMTLIVGPNPRTFHLRAPRNLDYCPAASTWWRYFIGGPGIVTGTATFTLKESSSAISEANLGPSFEGLVMVERIDKE